MDKGKLYIVATPIGNLKDITLRALDILAGADVVAAEDTRHSGLLLKHYGIKTRLLSYHEHSKEKKDDKVLSLLEEGKNVALISDAGTPLISDPGYPLVKAARAAGIEVVGIPGPCAAVTALSAAAAGDGRFVFWGFLDAKSAARKKQLLAVKEMGLPVVLYESPHRLFAALKDILAVCGGAAEVTVARELTKMYEEYWTGSAAQAVEKYQTQEPRGEFVLIVYCKKEEKEVSEEEIRALLQECAQQSMTKKDAVAYVAKRLHLPKNKVYKISVD
jgi:16S rRNA (cytidine1402-2'-O)-methyltransferase